MWATGDIDYANENYSRWTMYVYGLYGGKQATEEKQKTYTELRRCKHDFILDSLNYFDIDSILKLVASA